MRRVWKAFPWVVLSVLLGCESGNEPGASSEVPTSCEGAAPSEADDCRAQRALGLAESNPDEAFDEAGQITDGASRDLVLLSLIRATGRDRCADVGDLEMQKRCKVSMDRPHLHEARRGQDGRATGSLCADQPGALQVDCLRQLASRASTPAEGVGICKQIGSPELSGVCITELVADAAHPSTKPLQRLSVEEAAGYCAEIEGPSWRGECFFRLADTLQQESSKRRYGLCEKAGEYHSQCAVHVVNDNARNVALGLVHAPPDIAFEQLEKSAGTIAKLVSAAPGVTEYEARRITWWHGLHTVLLEASLREELEAWRSYFASLPETEERRLVGMVLVELVSTWQHLADNIRNDGELATLENLREWTQKPLPPSQAKRALIGRVFHRAEEGHGYTLGVLPQLLEEPDCIDSVEMRTEVVAIWAMTPFPWEAVRPAVEKSFQHSDSRMRLFAMNQVADRSLERFLDSPPPEWLFDALNGLSDDPAPAVSRYASSLAESLRRGNRPKERPLGCSMSLAEPRRPTQSEESGPGE